MVELSRKAFIRSVEAILAIILFLTFYSEVTGTYIRSFKKDDPSFEASSALNLLDESFVSELVQKAEFSPLENLLSSLLIPNKGFKMEVSYYKPIVLTNEGSTTIDANYSIFKFFPDSVNPNSVVLFDRENSLIPLYFNHNFRYVKLLVSNSGAEIYNSTISLSNIRIYTDGESINESSIRAVFGSVEVPVSLDSTTYNSNYYDANISVTVLIPYAEPNEQFDLYIFYGWGNLSLPITYPSLPSGTSLEFVQSEPKDTPSGELTLSISLEPYEEDELLLYYEINTDTNISYSYLTPTQADINVEYDNSFYEGQSVLEGYEYPSTFSVSREIGLNNGRAKIRLKVWNYE